MISNRSLFAQRAAVLFLSCLLFVIPFSKAGIEILFPLLLVAWLLGWKRPWDPQHPIHQDLWAKRTVLFLLGYVVICTWSAVLSDHTALSLRGLIRKTFEYVLLFIIAMDVTAHPSFSIRRLRPLLAGAWFVGIYGIIQEAYIHSPFIHVGVIDPIRRRPFHFERMVGPYENPNDLATYLMVAGLVVVALLMLSPRKPSAGRIALASLLLGCLIWVQSLGAFLGFAAGFGLLLFAIRHRKRLVWALSGLMVGATALFLFLSHFYRREAVDLTHWISDERAEWWQIGWAMVKDRPVIGHGVNTFMANYKSYTPYPDQWPAYAHNCYLQILAETGALGLGFFLLFLGTLFMLFRRAVQTESKPDAVDQSPDATPWLWGIWAGLTAFLVQSAFDTNFYALRQAVLFWTLAGVAAGLSMRARSTAAVRQVQVHRGGSS